MKIATLLIASVLSANVFAADNYVVESSHTFPSFEISHLGFSMQRGRFNTTTGKIVLDGAKSTVEVSIDTNSLDTGLDKLEEHLKGEDFFNVAQYPAMTFKSTHVKFKDKTLTSVEGDLTLHGVTKPVVLTVDHFKCGDNPITKKPTCGANAVTTIKRSDFGITKYLPAVGDDVKIAIQIEAVKE